MSLFRRIISKNDLKITVTIESDGILLSSPQETSSSDEDENMEEAPYNEAVNNGITALEKYIEERGYTDFEFELVGTPYETNRGIVWAKGSFVGPNPFGKESRAPEDLSTYSFIVVEDVNYAEQVMTIEVKHESAIIASFKIDGGDIQLLDGDIPHV